MLSEYVEKVLKIREECPRQSMAVREYALVYMVAEKVKPRRILEAGTGYGFSTRVLHEAYPTAEIDSIDNLSDRLGEEWGKYVRGVRNVHLICGDSKDIIPRLVQERDYGLALLDDGHSEEIVFKNVVDCAGVPVVIVHDAFTENILKALNRSGQPFKSYRFDPVDEVDARYFSRCPPKGIGIWARGISGMIHDGEQAV